MPYGMSRPASNAPETLDDPRSMHPARVDLLRKLSWQEPSPISMPALLSQAPPFPIFCSSPPPPTLLSETALELAQTRAALAESNTCCEHLARALAERMARERQYENLARAAVDERDELAATCSDRLNRVQHDLDGAVLERDNLRLALSHLNLVDSSGFGSGSSTDADESDNNPISTILCTVRNELKLENAYASTRTHIESETVALQSIVPQPVNEPHTRPVTKKGTIVQQLLTPKLTPILTASDSDTVVSPESAEPSPTLPTSADNARQRRQLLESFPVPKNMPSKEPPAFSLTSRFSFSDVFGHSLGNRSTHIALSGYHVLCEPLTIWPSEDHTHGLVFAPTIRCFSLSVAGTFSWREVDVVGPFNKPTECFYRVQESNYHYAGIYRGSRLADVSPEEYMTFSSEMKEALVDATLRDRRAVAPQLRLDVKQLYELGALKIACVAMQCTGYNKRLCDAVYQHVEKCHRLGEWKGVPFD
ncbi:hypothetical protein BKA62DRAFT_772175 [Auriculariales sp. MPI-PUGE-AT-0066]|nr:hypothetical protein BKA62DRAFT_772175 [Auriculariales sp. MPI-PUGE-AT-0066]